MLTTDFSFELPPERIAQTPPEKRGESRLMVYQRRGNSVTHARVADIARFIPEGAVMVFNDSKVRRARLYARTESGGAVELVLLRREGTRRWAALTSRMAKLKHDRVIFFEDGVSAAILEVRPDERLLEFSADIDDTWLDAHGHIPLPPYISRADSELDAERYQTIYARETGSAAAPTAGLHFTEAILTELRAAGIELCFVTLHVGLGTFLPVRARVVEEHVMHRETYTVPQATSRAVTEAKAQGRPVIAVGTTSLRTLESAWTDGALQSGTNSTDIFIYPGYSFKAVDALFTNFHTPESSLLMLVSAFAGKDAVLAAYKTALAERYNFFSYGDAMLIL